MSNPKNNIYIGVVGASLLASITLWEGNTTVPYLDPVGIPTVCSGITENVNMKKVYTKQECEKLNTEAIAEYGNGILKCINVPISRNEYEAYTRFAYNIGINNACGSLAIKELNSGRHTEACYRISTSPSGSPVWAYAGGKYFKGLENRRKDETNTCLRPD
jgi:lysozyme